MSRISIVTAREGRPFKGRIKLILRNGAGAYILPAAAASYELRLFRHKATAPFATGTIANAKIAIASTAEATQVTYSFAAADMAVLPGYGSMELISTVAGSLPVCVPPLQLVSRDTPYTIESGEQLVVYDETVVCVVDTSIVLEASNAAQLFITEAQGMLCARHLIMP